VSALFEGSARAILFDLDGTLVDTAPDMVAALQELQRSAGIEPVPYAQGRSQVSNGAMGLLKLAFPDEPITPDSALLCDFIARYKKQVCDKTEVFAGLDELLTSLENKGVPWGVVTNKPGHLTIPIMDALGLAHRSASIVSGDTLPTRKPDPATLLHACTQAGVIAADCIYVGDALRDIEAGKNAGMAKVAVGYGYVADDDDPLSWNADRFAADVPELVRIVRRAVNLENS
jgi:phosphoglycolate phosphatase